MRRVKSPAFATRDECVPGGGAVWWMGMRKKFTGGWEKIFKVNLFEIFLQHGNIFLM